ncbi:MAG: hypothetical protein KDC56_12485, partial [Flavobacteriaceae bacterium]|nr:hypothetical protein [Flavobacteriaceae bacterium]
FSIRLKQCAEATHPCPLPIGRQAPRRGTTQFIKKEKVLPFGEDLGGANPPVAPPRRGADPNSQIAVVSIWVRSSLENTQKQLSIKELYPIKTTLSPLFSQKNTLLIKKICFYKF